MEQNSAQLLENEFEAYKYKQKEIKSVETY